MESLAGRLVPEVVEEAAAGKMLAESSCSSSSYSTYCIHSPKRGAERQVPLRTEIDVGNA
jgi:hypothetical protein